MSIYDYLTDFSLSAPDFSGRTIHAIAVHIGWLNWGSVGDESMDRLIEYFDAEKIAEFERPGDFYDFVSYRERSFTFIDKRGIRRTEFPNSRIYYVKREEPKPDLVLLSLLEPNHFSEIWAERIVSLMKRIGISRYTVAGSMGSPVPHTRPLRITGRSINHELTQILESLGVRQTLGQQYQGPTSIFNAISMRLTEEAIPAVSLMAHLPSHITLQEPDFTGVYGILKILSRLEDIEMPLEKTRIAGKRQYDRISKEIRHTPGLAELSRQLEDVYDQEENPLEPETIELPPNIQKAIDEAFGRD